jgi:hypothetical protein
MKVEASITPLFCNQVESGMVEFWTFAVGRKKIMEMGFLV